MSDLLPGLDLSLGILVAGIVIGRGLGNRAAYLRGRADERRAQAEPPAEPWLRDPTLDAHAAANDPDLPPIAARRAALNSREFAPNPHGATMRPKCRRNHVES